MKKISFTFTLLLLALATYPQAYAKTPVSIRFNMGAINYPLPAWSDFLGGASNSEYKKDNINLYGSLAFYYDLSPKHALFVGTEYLRTNASCQSVIPNITEVNISWKFKATPIDLGYEYKFGPQTKSIHPILTLGVSYFISEVLAESYTVPEIYPPQELKRTGKGYGFFGVVGLHKQITESFYAIANFRARYADGMYFDDDPGAIDVEFTSVDVNLGIGWRF